MPNLRDIEKRINSVTSTKQITRTMEMVATAKIRKSTERIVAATPYAEAVVETLEYLASRISGEKDPLLTAHDEVKRVLMVVVASDRGLAGGFNSGIFRQSERLMKRMQSARGIEVDIIACGKKTISYFSYRKIKPILEYRDLSADPTCDQASAIAAFAMQGYRNGDYDEVIVIYNHMKNAAEQVIRQERVLPIADKDFEEKFNIVAEFSSEKAVTDKAAQASAVAAQAAIDEMVSYKEVDEKHEKIEQGDIVFEPDEATVMAGFLPAYVRTVFWHALIDSAAAEQGARRTAMKAATDNATEMVDSLSRIYNRVRQGAITTEITEIVGGAAALEE